MLACFSIEIFFSRKLKICEKYQGSYSSEQVQLAPVAKPLIRVLEAQKSCQPLKETDGFEWVIASTSMGVGRDSFVGPHAT
jgi:hypothetical protein